MPDRSLIANVVLNDGKVFITLSDGTFLVLTGDQLLALGVPRYPITKGSSLASLLRAE